MGRKFWIIFGCILATISFSESRKFIKRFQNDRNFISNALKQRTKIGERDLIGGHLKNHFSWEEKIRADALKDRSFTKRLVSSKNFQEEIKAKIIRVMNDIERVSDRPGQYDFLFFIMSIEALAESWPGGIIGLSPRLYRKFENEAELAGVIAHEMSHIMLCHSFRLKNNREGLIYFSYLPAAFLIFTDQQQIEADILAVQYLVRAGYDPKEFLNFSKRLGHSWERKEAIKREMAELKKIYPRGDLKKFKYMSKDDFSHP